MNAAYASVVVQNLKVALLDQRRGAAPASMLDCAAHMLLCFDEPGAMYSVKRRQSTHDLRLAPLKSAKSSLSVAHCANWSHVISITREKAPRP